MNCLIASARAAFFLLVSVWLGSPGAARAQESQPGKTDVLFIFCEDKVIKVAPASLEYGAEGRLGTLWEQLLAQKGLHARSMLWKDFTAADLAQAHCVVMVMPGLHYSYAAPDAFFFGARPGARDLAKIQLLKAWVQAGGGLLFGQVQTQDMTHYHFIYDLADAFNADVLFETVTDPGTAATGGTRKAIFYQAFPAGPPAITEGCHTVWYPTTQLAVAVGVLPILAKDGWQPILVASPTARSKSDWSGLDYIDKRHRPEGFQHGGFPLAAVRQMGKGRVAFLGENMQYLAFTKNTLQGDAALVSLKGFKGIPSDLQHLTLNLLGWLDRASPGPIDESAYASVTLPEAPKLPLDPRSYRGVIGAISSYSSGQSTPDEYVAAAKAAGLDYIAFTDDLASLTGEKYEKLTADCRRLSGPHFIAFPGIRFEDEYGDKAFAFGYGLEMISSAALNAKRQLLIHPPQLFGVEGNMNSFQYWLYSLSGFNIVGTFYDYAHNAIPYYDSRDVQSLVVVREEGGQVITKNLAPYGDEQENGQSRLPLAVSFMHSASEVAQAHYRNIVFAEGFAQLSRLPSSKAFETPSGAHGPTLWPDTAKTFISSGPEILLHPGSSDLPGYEGLKSPFSPTTSGVFHPDFWRSSMGVEASSPKGLSDIFVYDGRTIIRHFRLTGAPEKFNRTIYFPLDRQHYLWVRVVDAQGGEAISHNLSTKSSLMQEVACGDRNNQLFYSAQNRTDGSEVRLMYGGPGAIPDKGSWYGPIRPTGYWVFDAKYGVERYGFYDGSPEFSPLVALYSTFLVGGKGASAPPPYLWNVDLLKGVEGAPHVYPCRVVSSQQVQVADRVMDGVWPPTTEPRAVILPVSPSKYLQTTARMTVYRIEPDGISAILWNQHFKILHNFTQDPQLPLYLQTGSLGDNSTGWAMKNGSAPVESGKIPGPVNKTFEMNKGDWFGCYGGKLGSVFIYVRADGLKLQCLNGKFTFGFASPKNAPVVPGTERDMDLMIVGMNRLTADPLALAQRVSRAYGLDGNAPDDKIQLEQGTLVSADFPVVMQADHGAVRGEINLPPAGLPGNLGMRIEGLNPNWTAAWEQESGSSPALEPMPAEKGIGYLTYDPNLGSGRFFAGNPVVATDPDVHLDVAHDAKGWLVEAHNPSDAAKDVTVSTAPGFRTFSLHTEITLPPGESKVLRPEASAP